MSESIFRKIGSVIKTSLDTTKTELTTLVNNAVTNLTNATDTAISDMTATTNTAVTNMTATTNTAVSNMTTTVDNAITTMNSSTNTAVTNLTAFVESKTFEWVVKTANYTATSAEAVACDTTGGSFTVTLPANPTTGFFVKVLDAASNFSNAPITIGRNGQKIMGLAEDMTVSTSNVSIELVFINSTLGWRLS